MFIILYFLYFLLFLHFLHFLHFHFLHFLYVHFLYSLYFLYSPNSIRVLPPSSQYEEGSLEVFRFWVVNKRLSLTTGTCNYYK